jgi:hypothetical protein
VPPLPPWCRVLTLPVPGFFFGDAVVDVAPIDAGKFLAITSGVPTLPPPGDDVFVYHSSDDGACWGLRATIHGAPSFSASAIASRLPFGVTDAALLGCELATGVSYVLATVDGGATWGNTTPDPADTIPGSFVVALVALSATDWLGFGQFTGGGGSNIIVSADGGATWTNIGVVIPWYPLTFPGILQGSGITAARLSDGSVVAGNFRPDAPDVWSTFRCLGPPWTVWTSSAPFPGSYPLGFNLFNTVLSIADCGGGVVMATLGPGFSMTDGAGDNPIWVYRSTDFGQTWALLDPLLDIVNAPFFPAGSPHMTATASGLLALGGGQVVLGVGGFQTPGDNPLFAPGWRVSTDNGLTFPDQGSSLSLPGSTGFWGRTTAMTPQTGGGGGVIAAVSGGVGIDLGPITGQVWATFSAVPVCGSVPPGSAAHFRSRTAAHQAALSVSRRAHGVRG